MSNCWYLYVLECDDGTLYTGITTDPERRLTEHNESPKGARYTRARRPVEMIVQWIYSDQSSAAKAEYSFKQLRRPEKLERIEADEPPRPESDAS